ncbi:MAG: hypothetical protein F4Z31_05535 [Gemmatimonadetes bacterium]|nr:hypothetical protein [Gemmatimonadota bacterium]MYE94477.1 hypothetical protein [Gemmatimonadota bacterium]MYJ12422.1 hypothetical protein [Gemmatimonadota bacterium]
MTTLRFFVERGRAAEQYAMIRSGVCMLYAHWEGFIVMAARSYLEYVAIRRIAYGQLKRNFLAVGLSHKIRKLRDQRNVTGDMDLVDAILESAAMPMSRKAIDVIDAKSNLSPRVLRGILQALGLARDLVDPVEEKILEIRLLRIRNRVAHGEKIEIDISDGDYVGLHRKVVELMDRFRDCVLNAASRGEYRA